MSGRSGEVVCPDCGGLCWVDEARTVCRDCGLTGYVAEPGLSPRERYAARRLMDELQATPNERGSAP